MKVELEEIVKPLLEWYQENRRMLPWREDKNPYHVWLSEIMLQQTRIEAVKEYYARFLAELPTIQELAEVEEEKLLKLWEGMGYYNRARNLKKAGQKIMQEYDGKMPKRYEDILTLPGIGEYTAGAISSICFNEKVLAIDGNVLRVISRIVASKKDILLLATKKEIAKKLEKIIPEEAGNFNEALMELGETICIPNGKPQCEKCPLQTFCLAKKKGLIEEIPVREKKAKRKVEEKVVFILRHGERVAVQKREEKGLLAGMYQFPNEKGDKTKKQIEEILKKWNLKAKRIREVGKAVHIFSHIEWHMTGYEIQVEAENEIFEWITKEQLENNFAIPTAFAKWKKII